MDPWAKDVEALNLSRSGGLPGPKRVPLFLKVLHGADTRDKRLVALKVGAAALPVLATRCRCLLWHTLPQHYQCHHQVLAGLIVTYEVCLEGCR